MARRWAWWTGLGLLAVVLTAVGAWRLAREIPERMRMAGDAIRREAAALGLNVSFRKLDFHPLSLRVSIDDLAVGDALSGRPLARSEGVDATLSIPGILLGGSPVSRIRVRDYTVEAGEGNRELFEKLRSAPSGEGGEPIPEIVLVRGRIRVGPVGDLGRLEADVPELRIRRVRFLGTLVSVDLRNVSGDLSVPAVGQGRLPFRTAEADIHYNKGVLHVRRLVAEGPPATLRASGTVDTAKRSGSVRASGTVDIARWIAAAAPGGRRLADFAGQGKVEFTVTADGALAQPAVAARAVLSGGRLGGDTPAEGEISVAVSGGRLRVESLKGRLWGGTLAGHGTYDFAAGAGEGKVSLSRAALGAAPWGKWGFSWRPAGAGDVAISASGGPGRIAADVSVSVPEGLERASGAGPPVRVPLSATASVELVPGRKLGIAALEARAGSGVVRGRGSIALDSRDVGLSGEFSVPAGRASEYGWDYALSWKGLSGDWGVTGDPAHLRVAAGVKAKALSMRALPPVHAAVRVEGDPAGLVHFVADVPADAVSVTAAGTLTGPLSRDPFLLEATVGARGIDFAKCGPWVAGVLSSLGRSPVPAERYAAGLAGTGSADIQLSVAKDVVTVSGAAEIPKLALRGFDARAVLVDGSVSVRGNDVRWKAKAGGVAADGTFALDASGMPGEADIKASVAKVDLGAVLSVVSAERGRRAAGAVAISLRAHYGPRGWEVARLAASAPRITVGGAVFEGVTADGSLGAVAGQVAFAAASPAVRASAVVRRESGWPARVRVAADNVPTSFLAAAAGRSDLPASGRWTAEGEGIVRLADLADTRKPVRDSIRDLRFSVAASEVQIAGIGVDAAEAEGRKDGDAVTGTLRTRAPDTGLAFSIGMREPFAFRLDGPFALGGPARAAGEAPGGNGNGKGEGKARLSLSGKARIDGVLGALGETRGTLQVEELDYRTGGIEVAGRDIAVLLEKEGVRWGRGSVQVAGNPVRVSGRATWDGTLDARLEGAIPAATIRLVTDVFERLDGTVRMELRLTGSYRSPSLVGTARLEGGIFSFRGYAQLFEDITAEAVISREKIVFDHFEGKSGGGYLDGRGELPLRFGAADKMFFSVDFFDVRYPYPEDFRPTVQGHAELFGPVDDLLVTGEVEVQSARYARTLDPEKAFLDFRRRLADVTARREKSEFRVRLDIEVIADGTIRVKNNLADAEAKGEFRVVGDTSRVVVLGSFDAVEGGIVTYRGNRYEVKRLNVDFQDPRRNNPRLDARAEARKGNVTVVVTVTGTLEKYEVELSSDPPLSKNDIVALLSLGVTAGSLAGSEGSVGVGTAAGLALGPYKGRVEEGIRGIVGLDKFAIEPSFSAATKTFEPKFIVGKSFGDRFSVSASTNVGASTESNVTAEVKLLENVYLQGGWESTTASPQGDLGGDLKFRYRYRQFKDLLRGRD